RAGRRRTAPPGRSIPGGERDPIRRSRAAPRGRTLLLALRRHGLPAQGEPAHRARHAAQAARGDGPGQARRGLCSRRAPRAHRRWTYRNAVRTRRCCRLRGLARRASPPPWRLACHADRRPRTRGRTPRLGPQRQTLSGRLPDADRAPRKRAFGGRLMRRQALDGQGLLLAMTAFDEPYEKDAAKPPISLHPAFPVIVALWFAALLGLGSLILPVVLLEHAVEASGLATLVPAAGPPLGFTARGIVAVTAALGGGIIGIAMARRIARAHRPAPESRIVQLSNGSR